MQDRIPTKPNRYAVYDDAHNFVRYEYHERADEPTQTGSAVNKANLLPDNVATALGLDPANNPQVKDGFSALKILIDPKANIETGSYIGTGTYGKDNPNSLTFNSAPKIAFIYSPDAYFSNAISNVGILLFNAKKSIFASFNKHERKSLTFNNSLFLTSKTISWYDYTPDASDLSQFNKLDNEYIVLCFG